MIYTWIVNALMVVWRSRIGQILLSALAWLGLTWGTQKVLIQPTVDVLYGYVTGMQSVGGTYAEFMLHGLGMMKADIAVTMCISAVGIRAGVVAARARWMRKV